MSGNGFMNERPVCDACGSPLVCMQCRQVEKLGRK